MAKAKTYIFGFLTFIIAVASVTVLLQGQNLKIKIENTKSTFSVFNNSWSTSGIEYNSILNGTKKLALLNCKINSTLSEDISIINRTCFYNGNVSIVDIYLFNGKIDEKELFPVSHTISIINGQEYKFQYDIKSTKYVSEINDSFILWKNMMVYYQDGYILKKHTATTINLVYPIKSDFEVYNIRLFDPIFEISSTTLAICYQESANVSNQAGIDGACNLNYGGSYLGGTSFTGGGGAFNDGNRVTQTLANPGCLNETWFKSIIAINFTWGVTDGSGDWNLTLPTSCYDYNSTAIFLQSCSNFGSGYANFSCFNGSYVMLRNNLASAYIYEDRGYWIVNYTPRVYYFVCGEQLFFPVNASLMRINASGNYSWAFTQNDIRQYNSSCAFSFINNGTTNASIKINLNKVESWYSLTCNNVSVQLYNQTIFNISANSTKNVNCSLSILDAKRAYSRFRYGTQIPNLTNYFRLGYEQLYPRVLDSKGSIEGVAANYTFNHGQVVNATLVNGVFGNAYNFYLPNSQIKFNSPPRMNVTNGFSVGLWYKTINYTANQKYFSNFRFNLSNGLPYFIFYIRNTTGVTFRVQANNSGCDVNSALLNSTIIDGNWHYIVGVYNITHTKLFFDGYLRDSDAISIPCQNSIMQIFNYFNATPCNLSIGNDITPSLSGLMNGSIDEVRIWNTDLSESEIQSEMYSSNPLRGDLLVLSMSLEQNNATHTFDTNHIVTGHLNNTQAMRFNGVDNYVAIQDSPIPELFSVANKALGYNGLYISRDGRFKYVLDSTGDRIIQYNLTIPNNISTAVYWQNLSISANETSATGLTFSYDETKFYIVGTSGDDVTQYNMTVANNIVTATPFTRFKTNITPNSNGITISEDDTKIYIVSTAEPDTIYQYNLSIATDLNSANNNTNIELNINAWIDSGSGLFFKRPTGEKMFVVNSNSDNVEVFTLSVPWDISTGNSDLVEFYVGNQDTVPQDLAFDNDGRFMYIAGDNYNNTIQYILPAAWNLSNQFYAKGFTLSAWIYPITQGETNGRIIDKTRATGGNEGFVLIVDDSNTTNLVMGSVNCLSAVSSVDLSTWSHVIATVNSSGYCKLYVNGLFSGTGNQLPNLSVITTIQPLTIGNNAGGTIRAFNGNIQDAMIFNRSLTQTEVEDLYHSYDYADIRLNYSINAVTS